MDALVNLTPHPITLVLPSGRRLELPCSGQVARVLPGPRRCEEHAVAGEAVPVWRNAPGGDVTGLPEARPGVFLLVSALVAHACPHRADLLFPGTGPSDDALRDASGRIVGVRALCRVAPAG